MPMLRPMLLALALCLPMAACAQPAPALQTDTALDIDRMTGRWYVIANIPYSLERGVVGSYVEYVKRPDGDLDEFYSGHARTFSAKLDTDRVRDHVVAGTNNATWRGDFLWPFYFHTSWIYVDPDYRIAVLGYHDRSLGWIFSRQPVMDDAAYQAALGRLAKAGYDTAKFQRVPQLPQQIGAAGFQ